MAEYREVTLEERERMREEGVFDINGNLPMHPGYTGIHRRRDGTYWFRGEQITDSATLDAITHRNDPAPSLAVRTRPWFWRMLRRLWA